MIYSIQLATARDADTIKILENELFPENSFNETTLRNEILHGLTWVAVIDELIVGYILCRGDGSLLDILRLGVLPNYRRLGIAIRLIDEVVTKSRCLMLTVCKDNNPAIVLYKKCGFRITGSMPQHNSWVMQLKTTFS